MSAFVVFLKLALAVSGTVLILAYLNWLNRDLDRADHYDQEEQPPSGWGTP